MLNQARYIVGCVSHMWKQNAVVQTRPFFTTRVRRGKRNFRKFELKNIRGSGLDKKHLRANLEFYNRKREYEAAQHKHDGDEDNEEVIYCRNQMLEASATQKKIRNIDLGEFYDHRGRRPNHIPEMKPEIIVPDLTGFQLKPYVSYKAQDIYQEKFTPEHLFYAIYAKKIKQDFEAGLLDEDGNPLHPSEAESMTAEGFLQKARQTGSDLFPSDPDVADTYVYEMSDSNASCQEVDNLPKNS